MSTVRILWVDNDVHLLESTVILDLRTELGERGLQVVMEKYPSIGGVDQFIRRKGPFDLIVLDVEFDDRTGFDLDDYPSIAGFATPVVIVSNHVFDENDYSETYRPQIEQFRDISLGAFPKNTGGVRKLAAVFLTYLQSPPVTAVVMSDIHLGQTISNGRELETRSAPLLADLREMGLKHRPNHLLLLGDLVTKGRVEDLPHVLALITQMQGALGLLSSPGSLHLCPGNHDALLNEPEPWTPVFERTIQHLAMMDPLLKERYRDRMGRIRTFHEQKDLLAVGLGAQPGVLFASLASSHLIPGPSGSRLVVPKIGEDQLADLNEWFLQSNFAEVPLKIALMHHPVYPSPLQDAEVEEPILSDSARVCRSLQESGFHLLFTGHSHYTCTHLHAMAALNTPAHAAQPRQLAVVSTGTLGGDPNTATPSRQYVLLRIGHAVEGMRQVTLTTRVYNPDIRKFCDGESLGFSLGGSILRKVASMQFGIN